MGIAKSILDFLFGKDPDIFDETGKVQHKHPDRLWDAWKNKYKTNPEINWRNHSGTQPKNTRQKPK